MTRVARAGFVPAVVTLAAAGIVYTWSTPAPAPAVDGHSGHAMTMPLGVSAPEPKCGA
jgi:hypothetical protein